MGKKLTLKEVSEAVGKPVMWLSQQIKDGKVDLGEPNLTSDGKLSMDFDLKKIYQTYGVCLKGYRPPSSDNIARLLEIALSVGRAVVNVLENEYQRETGERGIGENTGKSVVRGDSPAQAVGNSGERNKRSA